MLLLSSSSMSHHTCTSRKLLLPGSEAVSLTWLVSISPDTSLPQRDICISPRIRLRARNVCHHRPALGTPAPRQTTSSRGSPGPPSLTPEPQEQATRVLCTASSLIHQAALLPNIACSKASVSPAQNMGTSYSPVTEDPVAPGPSWRDSGVEITQPGSISPPTPCPEPESICRGSKCSFWDRR